MSVKSREREPCSPRVDRRDRSDSGAKFPRLAYDLRNVSDAEGPRPGDRKLVPDNCPPVPDPPPTLPIIQNIIAQNSSTSRLPVAQDGQDGGTREIAGIAKTYWSPEARL